MNQGSDELLTEALDCMRQGKALVDSLDQSPAMIRNMPQARQARAVSVRALRLVAELVRRLQADQQAETQGGEGGNEK